MGEGRCSATGRCQMSTGWLNKKSARHLHDVAVYRKQRKHIGMGRDYTAHTPAAPMLSHDFLCGLSAFQMLPRPVID